MRDEGGEDQSKDNTSCLLAFPGKCIILAPERSTHKLIMTSSILCGYYEDSEVIRSINMKIMK